MRPVANADYLGWADADFDADKATKDVARTIDYTVTRSKQGRLVADVRVVTKNAGDKTPINQFFHSYLRVYAPLGAELVDKKNHEDDVRVDKETGLRTFGASQVVDPHSQGERRFVYYLPQSVVNKGTYRLVVRPQAGTPHDVVNVTLNLGPKPVRQTYFAVDGDRLLTARATGKRAAVPSTWKVSPPATIPASCRLTVPQPPPVPAEATGREFAEMMRERQRQLRPVVSEFRAKNGCKGVEIAYDPTP